MSAALAVWLMIPQPYRLASTSLASGDIKFGSSKSMVANLSISGAPYLTARYFILVDNSRAPDMWQTRPKPREICEMKKILNMQVFAKFRCTFEFYISK
jgi:hypothetical protein